MTGGALRMAGQADGVTAPLDRDAAVTELFLAHHARLVIVAQMIVGDLATAEDVVQDAFAACIDVGRGSAKRTPRSATCTRPSPTGLGAGCGSDVGCAPPSWTTSPVILRHRPRTPPFGATLNASSKRA